MGSLGVPLSGHSWGPLGACFGGLGALLGLTGGVCEACWAPWIKKRGLYHSFSSRGSKLAFWGSHGPLLDRSWALFGSS
eukprot:8471033-Pyramimonas_sp.AAC.1